MSQKTADKIVASIAFTAALVLTVRYYGWIMFVILMLFGLGMNAENQRNKK